MSLLTLLQSAEAPIVDPGVPMGPGYWLPAYPNPKPAKKVRKRKKKEPIPPARELTPDRVIDALEQGRARALNQRISELKAAEQATLLRQAEHQLLKAFERMREAEEAKALEAQAEAERVAEEERRLKAEAALRAYYYELAQKLEAMRVEAERIDDLENQELMEILMVADEAYATEEYSVRPLLQRRK